MDFLSLASGSDVRGIAVAQPEQPATLTEEVARRVGAAYIDWLAKTLNLPVRGLAVAIGRDSRISGPALLAAAAQGMADAGARVLDCGLCTTPAMFMTTVMARTACQGAVMVTASHHPWTRNGLKFFTAQGGLSSGDIRWILTRAAQGSWPRGTGDASEQVPFLRDYAAHLAQLVRRGLNTQAERPLAGLHVVVDAGNGAGGFYAELLTSLGADTVGSQYLEPDGRFPNHVPNPEDDVAMASICDAVRRSGADVGVIFDADCDRAAIVDAGGIPIHRNRLIALTAAMLLQEKPGGTVVTDSVTSTGLSAFIAARGGKHLRYRRGYRNVIEEALRLNAAGEHCPLAMETSGHAALQENYFLDDGMYLVTRLIVVAMQCRERGQHLSDWIADLAEAVESQEVRLPITAPDFRAAGEATLASITAAATGWQRCQLANDNHEGVRLYFDLPGGTRNAWLMLRLSVHDPVLPINVESDVHGGATALLTLLQDVLHRCPGIDCAPLDALLD